MNQLFNEIIIIKSHDHETRNRQLHKSKVFILEGNNAWWIFLNICLFHWVKGQLWTVSESPGHAFFSQLKKIGSARRPDGSQAYMAPRLTFLVSETLVTWTYHISKHCPCPHGLLFLQIFAQFSHITPVLFVHLPHLDSNFNFNFKLQAAPLPHSFTPESPYPVLHLSHRLYHPLSCNW